MQVWQSEARGSAQNLHQAVKGANDRINMAVIGIRNQGGVHIDAWCSLRNSHNVFLKTLCDTDEALFGSRIRW